MYPPASQLGPITEAQRRQLLGQSMVAGVYEKTLDRESAYEILRAQGDKKAATEEQGRKAVAQAESQEEGGMGGMVSELLFGSTGPRGGKRDGLVQTMAKSAVRTVGTSIGRQILRGVLGGILGGRR
jgi:hypothetical protein